LAKRGNKREELCQKKGDKRGVLPRREIRERALPKRGNKEEWF